MLLTGTITWSEGVRLYVEEHSNIYHRSVGTRQLISGLLNKFQATIGDLPLDEITKSSIRRFMSAELQAGCSEWTVNAHVIKIRSFLKWLMDHEEKFLLENPADGIAMVPQSEPDSKGVDEHVVLKLLETLEACGRKRLYQLSATVSDMGPRLSELLAMRTRSLDFRRGLAWVENHEHWKVKTKTNRRIPMTDLTQEIFEELAHGKSSDELLWSTASGKPLGRQNMLRDLQLFARSRGICPNITFQGIRKMWETRMYNLYPPEVVRYMANNSPETARRHYIHSEQFVLPRPESIES